jgi:hypothetical protein
MCLASDDPRLANFNAHRRIVGGVPELTDYLLEILEARFPGVLDLVSDPRRWVDDLPPWLAKGASRIERRSIAIAAVEAPLGFGAAFVPSGSMGPVVEALRGLRGLEMLSAVTFVAGIGDLGRFDSPSQLMAYLGLVPSEHSSGDRVRRGGITKTGNGEARRMLVEAAWSYRYPPRVAWEKVEVLVRLPKPVRDIAWKAQVRLCDRYRKLTHSGKKPTVVVTAIARELAGFVWAIGQQVRPAAP